MSSHRAQLRIDRLTEIKNRLLSIQIEESKRRKREKNRTSKQNIFSSPKSNTEEIKKLQKEENVIIKEIKRENKVFERIEREKQQSLEDKQRKLEANLHRDQRAKKRAIQNEQRIFDEKRDKMNSKISSLTKKIKEDQETIQKIKKNKVVAKLTGSRLKASNRIILQKEMKVKKEFDEITELIIQVKNLKI